MFSLVMLSDFFWIIYINVYICSTPIAFGAKFELIPLQVNMTTMAVLFLAEFQLFAQRVEINNHRCRNYNKNVRGSNLNRYTFFAFPFDY